MRIDVLALPQSNSNWDWVDKKVVVLDILRATSSTVTALGNKAIEVIPVVEPGEAIELVKSLGARECVVGGERKGLKIEGFELGNSPAEYGESKVAGKKVILCTTNGTKAIKNFQGAAEVLIGSFLNVQTIADYVKEGGMHLVLVCSGRDQHLCLEDLACAGLIVKLLEEAGVVIEWTDSAKLAYFVWEKAAPDLEAFIRQTEHGRYLSEIGLGGDIPDCLALNKFPLLPRYVNGKVAI